MSLLFFFLNEGNNAYILEFEKNMEEMINTSISSYGKWDPLLNLRLIAEMLAPPIYLDNLLLSFLVWLKSHIQQRSIPDLPGQAESFYSGHRNNNMLWPMKWLNTPFLSTIPRYGSKVFPKNCPGLTEMQDYFQRVPLFLPRALMLLSWHSMSENAATPAGRCQFPQRGCSNLGLKKQIAALCKHSSSLPKDLRLPQIITDTLWKRVYIIRCRHLNKWHAAS